MTQTTGPGPVVTGPVPPELIEIVRRHGQVVAAGDNAATLSDFRPDRAGQLIGSARLPEHLVGSELLELQAEPDGLVAAFIRYTAADGGQTVLRSRWIRLEAGWRVTQVRNLPDTPPVLAAAGPGEDGLDAPHWEGLRAGEVRVQRCAGCGLWIWAPRPLCPRCHGFDLRWPAVDPAGTVYSWTRTWQPFSPELSGHLPFTVVLAELPAAGGRRLLGVLRDADGADVRVAQQVTGDIDPPASPGGWQVLRWRLA
ncbi:MAG: zinc ribbon domain-containing protein [Streptosporangiaceae bacterium]